MTDESGIILNHYVYDAFGNRTVKEEGVQNQFGFTGEICDGLTGQYYLRARFYNPVIGRFLNEDTYYGDGLNLYSYCRNNPVRYVDPSGHWCEEKQERIDKYKEHGYSEANAEKMANYEKLRETEGVDAAEKYLREQKAPNMDASVNNSNKNPRGLLSDYLGVPEKNSKGKFYSIENAAGGEVYVSTEAVFQSDFENIVKDANGKVNIITGVHGGMDGSIVPEIDFYVEDVNTFGHMPNVDIHNFAGMEYKTFETIINSNATTILGWCFSEYNPTVRMGIKIK